MTGLQSFRRQMRGWHWLAMAAVLASLLTAGLPAGRTARAQDEVSEEVVEEAAETVDQPGETATDDTGGQPESFLAWMIRASGVFGFLLLLVSFIMVALIMMNVLQLRRDNFLPPDFIEAFEQKLAAKDYQGAYETAKNDDSFVARILTAGLGRLSRGYEEAIEGMQEVGEDETMAMEHKLSYLALIGSVAPMLGLMGTVKGMIASFQVIANSPVQPKPKDLADGISTALFTTLEGLTVAIPAMIFYSILKNRMSRFVLETGMVSEGLMSRFASLGKTSAGRSSGGGATATAPAAPQKTE